MATDMSLENVLARLDKLEQQIEEFKGNQYKWVGTTSPAPGGLNGHFHKNFGCVLTWLRFLADRLTKLEQSTEQDTTAERRKERLLAALETLRREVERTIEELKQ